MALTVVLSQGRRVGSRIEHLVQQSIILPRVQFNRQDAPIESEVNSTED